MRIGRAQQALLKRILAGILAGVMFLGSGSGFARGARGGGAAGALDDFDLFLLQQVSTGLPTNLVNGFAPAGGVPGDATTGVGGILQFNGLPDMIVSQSGQMVALIDAGTGGGRRAGFAQQVGPDGLPPMLSLKSVAVPPMPGLSDFIRDPDAAVRLGKALFWDVQAGSDGNACASCHFHAGADNRMKNQLSPGLKSGDTTFQRTASGGPGGPNTTLKPDDFPFHQLKNLLDRNSDVVFDSNDVVSSQGTFGGAFKQLGPNGTEVCGDRPTADTSFNVKDVMTRRVPPRNAPTTINAVFNYRNFWDGRANNAFNGVNPFGPRDPDAKVLESLSDGSSQWTTISITNASLASQAVGPILSDFEMSCANRTFQNLARKLLALQPLARQTIHVQDSVLANLLSSTGRGLKKSYPEMIKDAFDPRWWNATDRINGYTQMENNFSLYWGLAIMMYESTLVSDEAPFDKFVGSAANPPDAKALTPQELRGLALFRGKGQCISCHKGAEFTGAATSLQRDNGEGVLVESMFLKTGDLAVYDNGFYNIGVRPAAEDRGVGATDPFGHPLSFSRTWFEQLQARSTVADPVWVDPCLFSIFFDASACWIAPDPGGTRIVADGAFKTPTLRNVALTQPYFHTGGYFTLEQVVEFYNRGGDRRGPDENDTTGFVAPDAPNGGTTNVHPALVALDLSAAEQADLVAFLRNGLTDQRVACEQAPFDHPSLSLHDGHVGGTDRVRDDNGDGLADDQFTDLPAVGASGLAHERCLRNDDGSELSSLVDDTR